MTLAKVFTLDIVWREIYYASSATYHSIYLESAAVTEGIASFDTLSDRFIIRHDLVFSVAVIKTRCFLVLISKFPLKPRRFIIQDGYMNTL